MKKFASIASVALILMTLGQSVFAAAGEDNREPSRVDGLKAEAYDGAVALSWGRASDNVGVTGYQVHYGTKSVDSEGEVYDDSIDVGNVTRYTLDELANGTQYYFSVVAYDAAGNESQEWAFEASAKPDAASGKPTDAEAPKVMEAEALNIEEVSVEFSEAVEVEDLEAGDVFVIENEQTFEELEVLKAELDEEDETDKTVILTTAKQVDKASYKLTVGVDVKDLAGNPVVSGTSDTAIFVGSALPKPADELSLDKVEAAGATTLKLLFNGEVTLGLNPEKNFEVFEVGNPTKKLAVSAVALNGTGDIVTLTTAEQMPVQYTVVVKNLLDSEVKMNFMGVAGGDVEVDTQPPKEAANFLAKKLFEAEKHVVKLSWKLVHDENEKLVRQTVYTSRDKGVNYSETAVLDAETTEYELMNLEAGEYWFKLTQTDDAGNESAGVVTKVMLAETGPELAGLLLMSLGAGSLVRRRKK